MRLRWIPLLLLGLLPASCFLWRGRPDPNLLLIVVDSLRFDALSRSAGSARTPNIQALAADGIAFPWCFSHSPNTLPAHAALLSSRMPHTSGVMNNGQAIAPSVPLLAETLAGHGYATHAVVSLASLWPPDAHAAHGAHAAHEPRAEHVRGAVRGLDRGFQSFLTTEHELGTAAEVNARLLPVVRSLPADRPWFVLAQYSDPHEPHDAHGSVRVHADVLLEGRTLARISIADTEWWQHSFELAPGRHRIEFKSAEDFKLRRLECKLGDGVREPRFVEGMPRETGRSFVFELENDASTPSICTLNAWLHDEPGVAQARARYKLEVEAVDREIGILLDELRARGLYDTTCIVLTADHGEQLGEHPRGARKSSLYDELLRVPLLVKPPKDHKSKGELLEAQHTFVRHVDVAPTVLEILGRKNLAGAEGSSVLEAADRLLIAETHPPEASSTMFGMRDDRYKLIFVAAENRFEMYDLPIDTMELENVFALQGHFREDWQKRLRDLAAGAPQAADLRMGWMTQTSERLKSLDY